MILIIKYQLIKNKTVFKTLSRWLVGIITYYCLRYYYSVSIIKNK